MKAEAEAAVVIVGVDAEEPVEADAVGAAAAGVGRTKVFLESLLGRVSVVRLDMSRQRWPRNAKREAVGTRSRTKSRKGVMSSGCEPNC